MRFGKRLTEMQTQNGQEGQHYISYKELKRTLGEVSQLVGSAGSDAGLQVPADSSGDEAIGASGECGDATSTVQRRSRHRASPSVEGALAASCEPSASSSSSKPFSARSALEDQQRNFFNRIDIDLSRASSHMQSVLAALEAAVGEWQSQAATCGLLFTPVQLEEVAVSLPFQIKDEEALVDWLIGIQPVARARSARQTLASRYCEITDMLHTLLQYIEVNVTAVRKILKKFEKKVPAEFRVQNAQSYKAHHELLSMDLQHLIVAVVHMHRLVHDARTLDPELKVANVPAPPTSFIGVETWQVLQKIRGPQELHDLLSGQPAARSIDVFAKPNTDLEGGNTNPTATTTGSLRNTTSTTPQLSQQAAANIGNTDLFQGPPKPHANTTNSTGATTGSQNTTSTTQNSTWSKSNPQSSGNAPGNGRGTSNANGRGGGRGNGSSAQDPSGKAGGKRGRGNRGQRGSNTGQPLQGGNGNRRAQNERQDARINPKGLMTASNTMGMEQSFAPHDTTGYPQGKATGYPQGMAPGMYMMVPTNWAGPPGSWKGGANQFPQASGKGKDGFTFETMQQMATWQCGTMPQQRETGVWVTHSKLQEMLRQ